MTNTQTSYRLGLALAVVTAAFLVLVSGAVGIIGAGEEDGVYLVVLVVALLGAVLARFRAGGMVLAMLATALTQAVVTATVLLAGVAEEVGASVFDLVGITAMYVALFAAAAWLFHRAARQDPVAALV